MQTGLQNRKQKAAKKQRLLQKQSDVIYKKVKQISERGTPGNVCCLGFLPLNASNTNRNLTKQWAFM